MSAAGICNWIGFRPCSDELLGGEREEEVTKRGKSYLAVWMRPAKGMRGGKFWVTLK